MNLRFIPFAVDLSSSLRTARGEIARREGFLVGVEDDSSRAGGVRGVGEATPLDGWTESYDECRSALGAARDARSPDEAVAAARDAPAARHGLALAVADARARVAGVPLARHLGYGDGATADAVPVNATVGDAPREETVAAARKAVDAGFDCIKVKVGARDLSADEARLRAVREAVGDGVTLRADANGAWDRETAARAVEAFAPLDLAYLEQPLPADDLTGLADLRGRGVPVAVDESVAARSLEEVLDTGAADAAVLKPMALGGPDRAVRAAARAREAGVDPVVTTTVDAAVARAAAVHVAAAVPDVSPCGLATAGRLAGDVMDDPVPVEDGRVRVPDGPGTLGDAADSLVWG